MKIVPALRLRVIGAAACAFAAWSCMAGAAAGTAARALGFRVVAEYPHDPTAFTEGLAFDGQGRLIESIGRYGHSALIVRDLASGRALLRTELEPGEFGEGATAVKDRIVQLTWLNEAIHVYDGALRPLQTFKLDGEGWGLTYDGRRLIQSDGSARLLFLDPRSFARTGAVEVRGADGPVQQLNELEYAGGLVYANVWHQDRIVVIEPDSGRVAAWLDLAPLRTRFAPPQDWDAAEDVLNGIAFDRRSGHFFVTGKCWPKLFEIAVEPVKQ